HFYFLPQGQCGSSWAFSATGALEHLHFKETRQRVSLSEQNLVDCSWNQGNRGCQSGSPILAFEYVRQNGGLNLEKDYPYEGRDDQRCRSKRENAVGQCASLKYVKLGDEKALEKAVATVGPMAVAIDARSSGFQFYKSGILSCPWGGDKLTQAVLAVGYDKAGYNGKDYWILKNSWSEYWGDKGYLYLEKGSNHCGVANDASYPVL
ncbi:procathepsin L-like, partial [Pogona vitticeps]